MLDIRRRFFTQRMVRCWIRLPRDVVDASSLKVRLDGTLGSLMYCLATLPMAEGLEVDDL